MSISTSKRKRELNDPPSYETLDIQISSHYDPESSQDLLTHSLYAYTIVLERRSATRQRVKLKSTPRTPNTIIEALCIRLPLRLTAPFWERHKLSLSDLSEILDKSHTQVCWLLSLFEHLPISNASTKSNHSVDTATFGSKKVANEKLMKLYRERYPSRDKWTPVLPWPILPEHHSAHPKTDGTCIPNPVHYVLETQLNYIDECFSQNESKPCSDTWFYSSILSFPCVWKWEKIYVVPYRRVKNHPEAFLMIRIIPVQEYIDYYGKPLSLVHCPDIVKILDHYWACVDEFFYMFPAHESSEKKLCLS